jgi:hypothetical protein
MMHHYSSTMGVGVAWPRSRFTMKQSLVERISNFITRTKTPKGYDPSSAKVRTSAWQRPKPPTSFIGSAWSSVTSASHSRVGSQRSLSSCPPLAYAFGSPLSTAMLGTAYRSIVPPPPPSTETKLIDEYEQVYEASRRQNVMVFVALQDKTTGACCGMGNVKCLLQCNVHRTSAFICYRNHT